ncbi:MAG: SCO family protein [Bdellovibrionota bacterium]
MKPYFLIALCFLALVSPTGAADEKAPESGAAEKAPGFPSDSLYQLESSWLTQDGKEIRLGSLAGSPVVIALVYTSCKASCPLILGDFRKIHKNLSENASRISFVLVSMDPDRDTPGRLKEFEKGQKFPAPGRWVLLNGKEESVRELAAALNVSYRKTGKEFAHSNVITVLDPTGKIAHQQPQPGSSVQKTIETIQGLLGGEGKP